MAKYTSFGTHIRVIRAQNNEILKDMANRLDVTSSFLSAIEVGKKNVPDDLINKLCDEYDLNNTESKTLREEAANSVVSIKINLQSAPQAKRDAALILARDFDDISDDVAIKISAMIKSGRKIN